MEVPGAPPGSTGAPLPRWIFYALYLRSGFFKALRESVRAAQYYKNQLYPAGTTPDAAVRAFRLKNPTAAGYIGANGVMYSYNEPLAYTYWLTGDNDITPTICTGRTSRQ